MAGVASFLTAEFQYARKNTWRTAVCVFAIEPNPL